MRSVDTSFLMILSSGGIVGSSYIMVYAAKWAIIRCRPLSSYI